MFIDYFMDMPNFVSIFLNMVWNLTLIYTLLTYYKDLSFSKTIENIGKKSLSIYLWHVAIIVGVKKLVHIILL